MRTIFDSKLELLNSMMLVMGSSMEEAVMTATKLLDTRDADAAAAVIDGDDEIDSLERDIESLCMKLLLTQQPVASDLRHVSAALKMVGDMERIGDQASDIAEVIMTLDGDLDPKIYDKIKKMCDQACDMVHNAVQAYVDSDREKSKQVIESDSVMNQLFEETKWDITADIQNGGDNAGNLVDSLMLAKYLERVGDHAKNIAEWVEYSMVGTYKGDLIG